MARLNMCIVGTAIALGVTSTGMGCALVGYNFDDYQPGAGGAGGDPSWSVSTVAQSTGTGGMTGSSTASGSFGENCANGTDDDSDGQIDCADADCPGFTCTPAAPAGWSGPIAFWQGPTAAIPGCAGAMLLEQAGAGSIDAPPADCQCSCSAPQGVVCSDMDMYFFLDGACTSPPMAVLTATNLVCMGVPQATASVFGKAPLLLATGTCQPMLTPMIASPSFTESALLCGGSTTPGGCTGTDVCAPVPSAPFSPHLCIYQAGDVACSDPAYTVKSLVYKTIADSRACGACSCAAPNIQCTGGTLVYADPNCGMPLANVLGPTCFGFAPIMSMQYTSQFAGACPPSFGSPTGGAQPADPITVCCSPP